MSGSEAIGGDGLAEEEAPGQRTLSLQDEKTAVQKRTYTRWMNVFLKRCDPPVEVQDLFVDVQDGRVLMALLEELSGCKLVYRFRPSSHRIFRLNNIAKALAFLDDRHVKLQGVDASGVADGVPRVVLRLLWKIISFFQVKEATGGLQRRLSSSLSSLPTTSPSTTSTTSTSSTSSTTSSIHPDPGDLSPCPGLGGSSYSSLTLPSRRRRRAREPRLRGRRPLKTLLLWVQRRTSSLGVEVRDFGRSWSSGLAFLALIKSIEPSAASGGGGGGLVVDLRAALSRDARHNLEEAFRIARDRLGIPALLEPEDVACTSPDERSVVTYLSMFLEYHSDADEDIAPDVGARPQVPAESAAEPGGFRETPAACGQTGEAEVFLPSLGETSEQLLWKRWSRRSPGGEPPRPNLHPLRRRTADPHTSTPKKKALPADQEDALSLSWMEEASEDHHVFRSSLVDRLCAVVDDDGDFSQSSEEGLYGLSALDSDEEDAYSYILDLHRQQQQHHQQKQQQSDDPASGLLAGPGTPEEEGPSGGGRRSTSQKRRLKGEPLKPLSAPPLSPPQVSGNGGGFDHHGGTLRLREDLAVQNAELGNAEEGRMNQRPPWVTVGSEVTLEIVRRGEEEDDEEGHPRVKWRAGGPWDGDEGYKEVNTTEGPAAVAVAAVAAAADDSVFREGSVRATEEISEFRGRFADEVRSASDVASELGSGPGLRRVPAGGDKTTEKSEDTAGLAGLAATAAAAAAAAAAAGEIKARSLGSENGQNSATAADTLPPSPSHIRGHPDERERHETLRLCEYSDPGRHKRIHGNAASAELTDVVGASLGRRESSPPNAPPVCRAFPVRGFSEKAAAAAAASSCDVTSGELEVLFGLWMFLFCYFLAGGRWDGDEGYKEVNTTEGPVAAAAVAAGADDSVFREGSVRATEEISEFRGRFADEVRSASDVASELGSGPGLRRVPAGGDKTTEKSEDTAGLAGLAAAAAAAAAAGEIKARSLGSENGQNSATAADTLPPSPSHIRGYPDEREHHETLRPCEYSDPRRHERIHAKRRGNAASAELTDVVGASLGRRESSPPTAPPVYRAFPVRGFSEKGVAASSCDVTSAELELSADFSGISTKARTRKPVSGSRNGKDLSRTSNGSNPARRRNITGPSVLC
ncbi:hypothetical protein CRUP_010013 [Coryphaenoides rupestris]|nr:hypothetical protein CRUP_010013 [Coryphaenoides rupestris]